MRNFDKRGLVFAILLSSVFSWGAIARTGTCTAAASSCTFSATATGDLKLMFAYNSSSATLPSTPAGWRSINGQAQSTTAARLGCNVSSSSADTGSGTWTNATQVVGISYSGTNGVNFTCDTSGAGGTASNGATASTTVTYAQIVLHNKTGSSWVAGFAGDSAAVPGAPTGMTQQTSAGTGPAAVADDTGAGVSTWTNQNVTVASSTWIAITTEIVAFVPCNHALGMIGAGCD